MIESKIESKIKSAETIINESHFLAHTIQIFTRKQVIELIKTAQHNSNQIEIGESPDVDWAAKCLYNGLLKEFE